MAFLLSSKRAKFLSSVVLLLLGGRASYTLYLANHELQEPAHAETAPLVDSDSPSFCLAPNCNDERLSLFLWLPIHFLAYTDSRIGLMQMQTIQLTSAFRTAPRERYKSNKTPRIKFFFSGAHSPSRAGAVCSQFFIPTTTPPLPTASTLHFHCLPHQASVLYFHYFALLWRLQPHIWQLRRTHSTFFPQFIFNINFHDLLLPFRPHDYRITS
ncbi:hypothetical protein R3P38DRAFT_1885811 [Favolaschia claudopus]|uniref:Secreted protein n=1 Tax=Favolaschia claudopus TaxID=2862362 RepID=A0AAW0DCU3_9AGAR